MQCLSVMIKGDMLIDVSRARRDFNQQSRCSDINLQQAVHPVKLTVFGFTGICVTGSIHPFFSFLLLNNDNLVQLYYIFALSLYRFHWLMAQMALLIRGQ